MPKSTRIIVLAERRCDAGMLAVNARATYLNACLRFLKKLQRQRKTSAHGCATCTSRGVTTNGTGQWNRIVGKALIPRPDGSYTHYGTANLRREGPKNAFSRLPFPTAACHTSGTWKVAVSAPGRCLLGAQAFRPFNAGHAHLTHIGILPMLIKVRT